MIPSHTLSRFIKGEEKKHWSATGELSNLISSIGTGVKIISSLIASSGFRGLEGYTGQTNVQGEAVQKLDEEADRTLIELLGTSGHFGLIVSEEQNHVVSPPNNYKDGKYVVAFDPLDGSGNLGLNIPVGTIFTVFKKKDFSRNATLQDFMQPGTAIVAAGYAVYGAKTTFVYSCGDGVHGFTLDREIGEFMLTESNITCPEQGSIYSINEGNAKKWDPRIRNYIESLKEEDSIRGTPYSARYVGSMVCDIDRVLRKGGIFLYPPEPGKKKGKLRLLYECMPLSFIASQAGGAATDGEREILSIVPEDIHQRSPLIIGSKNCIKEFLEQTKA